jgi:hypothetical protein
MQPLPCPLSCPTIQVTDIIIIEEAAFGATTVWVDDVGAGVHLGHTVQEALQKLGFLVVPSTNIKATAAPENGPRRECHG